MFDPMDPLGENAREKNDGRFITAQAPNDVMLDFVPEVVKDFSPTSFKTPEPTPLPFVPEIAEPRAYEEAVLKDDPWEPNPDYKDGMTVEDLSKNPQAQRDIRDYMVRRMGVQYEDAPWEKVEEDWADHMRYIDVNEVSTFGEATWVNRANSVDRKIAANAYDLWDKRANVFVGGDMLDGLTDYVEAIATSPSTYLGLAVGSLLSKGGSKAASTAVKEAARLSARRMAAGVPKGAKFGVMRKAYQDYLTKNTVKPILGKTMTGRVGTMAVAEGTAAAAQDKLWQDTRIDTGMQEGYDILQGALSTTLGALGGAMDQWFAKGSKEAVKASSDAAGLSGPASFDPDLIITKIYDMAKPVKGEQRRKLEKEAVGSLLSGLKKLRRDVVAAAKEFGAMDKATRDAAWQVAIGEGKKKIDEIVPGNPFGKMTLSPEEIGMLVGGEGDTNSVLAVMKRIGMFRDKDMRVTQQVTEFLSSLSGETKNMFERGLRDELGLGIEDFNNVLTYTANTWGSGMNILQRFAKGLDVALGEEIIQQALTEQAQDPNFVKAARRHLNLKSRPELMQFVQDTYRRMLVSSPQTTGMNFLGSTAYWAHDLLSDAIAAPIYWMAANAPGFSKEKRDFFKAAARSNRITATNKVWRIFNTLETMRSAKALVNVDKKAYSALTGVSASGTRGMDTTEELMKRYNMEEASDFMKEFVKRVDRFVNGIQVATGVHTQDFFWKSHLMFTELDRTAIAAGYDSIEDVISKGDYAKIFTMKEKQRIAQDALKGVFSADYGQGAVRRGVTEKLGFANDIADLLEGISRTPVLGAAFPFGKFAANTVATAYQWSFMPMVVDLIGYAAGRTKEPLHIKNLSKFAASMAGVAGAYQIIDQNKKDGAPPMSFDTGSGIRADVSNAFPTSLIFGTALALWEANNEGSISSRTMTNLAIQAGYGQIADDLEMKEFINRLTDSSAEEGSNKALMGFAKIAGNFVAGFTRPLQIFNEVNAQSLYFGSASSPDRRQATGTLEAFKMEATRYTDFLIDMFTGDNNGALDPRSKQRMANLEQDSYLVNSLLKGLTGVKEHAPLTHTTQLLERAGIDSSWIANSYTGSPMFDKFANKYVFEDLESLAKFVMNTKEFREGNRDERKVIVHQLLNKVKSGVREMLDGSFSSDERKAALQRSITFVRDNPKRSHIFRTAIRNLGYQESNPLKMTLDDLNRLQREIEAVSSDRFQSIR